MNTCTVIFRDSDDNKQEAKVSYQSFVDDRNRLIVNWCFVHLAKELVRSGDDLADVESSIALNENRSPWEVIVKGEIEFEIMEEVTEIKCKAA